MTQVCSLVTVDGLTCVQCPEVIGIPGVPAKTTYTSIIGWNGSAHSLQSIGGDAFVKFSAPSVLGTVVGFAHEHVDSAPRNVACGFYLYRVSGRSLWSVVEAGVEKTTPVVRSEADVYRIERRGTLVTYFVNNRVVYTSSVVLSGTLIVVSCLYGSGDGVD